MEATESFTVRESKVWKRDSNDWYVEPRWCVDLLLEAERFVGTVWDPAAGSGTIPAACRAIGLYAIGSDAVERGNDDIAAPFDFLAEDHRGFLDIEADNIIFNPPYGLAAEFIEKALTIARFKVAVLVQQQFPFSQGRFDLFTKHPVSRLYFLSTRPSMPPGEALAAGTKPAGGKVDYLWIVFDHDHKGPPTAHWLKRAA